MSKQIYALGTAAGVVGTLGLGALVARRFLFPAPYSAAATVLSATDTDVELAETRDTRLPGTFRLQRDARSVRVGKILTSDGAAVRREAAAKATAGEWAWDALMYDGVDDVPGATPGATTTHVIHVHGQSLGPRQVFRGIGVWRSLGASSEVIDLTDLPLRSLDSAAADRIIASVHAARERGATRVVLHGWSAGALACSIAATRVDVDALVGISPLLSVKAALQGAVAAAHLPRFVGSVAYRVAGTPALSRLARAAEPVQITNWQLSEAPTLLVHSKADTLVNDADVAALAAHSTVETATFETAPHTLEWNEDPERWEGLIRSFAEKHSLAG